MCQTSLSAQDDYDMYINAQWKEANPVPDDQVRWGSFVILSEDNKLQLRTLCEQDTGLIGQLYKTAMVVPTEVSKNVLDLCAEIQEIHNLSDYWTTNSLLFRSGISTLFHICKSADDKAPIWNIPHIFESGLGLPDMSYYEPGSGSGSGSEAREKLHGQYKKYIGDLFTAYGLDGGSDAADQIFEFESRKAKLHLTRVQARDTDKTYNKLDWNSVLEYCPDFFNGLDLPDMTDVLVHNPDLMLSLGQLVADTDLTVLKEHLTFKVLAHFAAYQTQEIVDLNFDFYGRTLSGQKTLDDQWKRALGICNMYLGDELGKLYVKEHFPAEKQQTCRDMVDLLKDSMNHTLKNVDWMSTDTKAAAIVKLESFVSKIGVPEKYHDIIGLWSDGMDDDLPGLLIKWSKWDWIYQECNKLYSQVDKELWHMTPQTINAYYSPTQNEIVFPAGILQLPFFGYDTMEENLGGIGAIIGHEMTHGFDDQGCKYNEKGELKQWWSQDDIDEFLRRAERVKVHYSSLKSFNVAVNGELTLGENIADIGGLKVALQALRIHYKDATTEQLHQYYDRFFRAYATVWRFNTTEEYALKLLVIDPHSPCSARINGALAHIDEFYETYNVKEGDGMYLPKDQRMNIW